MTKAINATFETRRQAEMAVERLVQEFGIERTDIFVSASGDENSVGTDVAGSDREAGAPSPETRDDGAQNGAVAVSVDLPDDAIAEKVLAAFEEFSAKTVAEI